MILEPHGSLEAIRVLKPYSIVTLGDMEAYVQVHANKAFRTRTASLQEFHLHDCNMTCVPQSYSRLWLIFGIKGIFKGIPSGFKSRARDIIYIVISLH